VMRSWRWRATRRISRGAPPAWTYFKMRGRGAFGRDAQACITGDKEHDACAG
jgi:hypothetical protein